MNTVKEVILQTCLLQFLTAEILRHILNTTNPNTINTQQQKLQEPCGSSGTDKMTITAADVVDICWKAKFLKLLSDLRGTFCGGKPRYYSI